MKFSITAVALLATSALTAAAAPTNSSAVNTSPDVLLAWNNATTQAIKPTVSSASARVAQPYAYVHKAISNALKQTSSRNNAEIDKIALAYAAHDVLSSFYPLLQRQLDNLLTSQIVNSTASQSDKNTAASIGKQVAAQLVQQHATDGSNQYVPYTGPKNQSDSNWKPGTYLPTPPAFNYPPVDPQDRYIKSIAVNAPIDSFIQKGPPSVNDTTYPNYIKESQNLGRSSGSNRTALQTETAGYWVEPSGIRWNNILLNIIKSPNNTVNAQGSNKTLTLRSAAELFSIYNYALYDTALADWANKYTYDAWRPVTAIQIGGVNGVTPDPTWTPYITTPDHQDYISNHAASGRAAVEVLKYWYGTPNISFTYTANITGVPETGLVTRTYTNLETAETDNANSRLYGGIHFSFSNADGQSVGRGVASNIIAQAKKGTFRV